MYKVINKDGRSYDNIARMLWGTPEKAGNIEKINNSTDGEIIVPDDEIPESQETGISCNIDGILYKAFPYSFLVDCLAGVRGAIFKFEYDPSRFEIKKGAPISVFKDGNLFLRGIANVPQPELASEKSFAILEAVSGAKILMDTVVPYPLDFSYMSVKTVINEICSYFNINVSFGSDKQLDYVPSTAIGNSFSAFEDEMAWDFIVRIASSFGLIVQDTGNGLFVGTIQEQKPKMSFIEGEAVGVYEWRSQINTDGLCRYYVRHTQYPEPATASAQIPLKLPLTDRRAKEDSFAGSLEDCAVWAACRAIGEAYKIMLGINDDLELQKGDFVIVKSETCSIFKETTFIVEDIYMDNLKGIMLVLTLPCAYTGIIPAELPLC